MRLQNASPNGTVQGGWRERIILVPDGTISEPVSQTLQCGIQPVNSLLAHISRAQGRRLGFQLIEIDDHAIRMALIPASDRCTISDPGKPFQP